MATSINCCLNSPPPPPVKSPPPTTLTRTTTFSPWPVSKERSWRSRCVTTVACVILSTAAVGLTEGCCSATAAEELHHGVPTTAVGSERGRGRWSDRRTCPPWSANSLESIVPENLPRPSSRRRTETVGVDRVAPAAGGASVILQYNSGCFSM